MFWVYTVDNFPIRDATHFMGIWLIPFVFRNGKQNLWIYTQLVISRLPFKVTENENEERKIVFII